MSIARVDNKSNIFELQILVTGKGTSLLSKIKKGETVQIIGPLGNNFSLPKKSTKVALLAGGIGVAPLIYFADLLTKKNIAFKFFYGAATKAALIPKNYLPENIHFSTDDGSFGFKGFVTQNFQSVHSTIHFDKIYACGPNPMLNEVKKIAMKNNVYCELSIETIMACGIGICQGCVVHKNTKEDDYFLTCVDGPVFKAEDINL
jgi:dihydroorotate dehydrogenase electron transfer subunit